MPAAGGAKGHRQVDGGWMDGKKRESG